MEDDGFAVTSAAIVGRGHAALRRNRQDAAGCGAVSGWAYGVVSDGCGSGLGSELGALVTVSVMSGHLSKSASSGRSPGDALVAALDDAVAALACIADRAASKASRRAFVTEHLLATALAFVVTPECGALLVSGDGVAIVDGDLSTFDHDNTPRYAGYAIIGLEAEPAHVVSIERPDTIAVATDGFDGAALRRAVAYEGPSLTRALRVDQLRGAFEDDAAIAIARRRPGRAP